MGDFDEAFQFLEQLRQQQAGTSCLLFSLTVLCQSHLQGSPCPSSTCPPAHLLKHTTCLPTCLPAGHAAHLQDIAQKWRDVAEQERQLYAALRTLGHAALQAPQRAAAPGEAPQASTTSGGGGPATPEALIEALRKVRGCGRGSYEPYMQLGACQYFQC